MAIPLIILHSLAFKAALRDREDAAMATMARRYLGVLDSLESHIEAMAAYLELRRDAGLPITKGSVYRLERYRRLQAQVVLALDGYSAWAAPYISAEQEAYIEQALRDAVALMGDRSPGLIADFDRVAAAAVDTMAGQAGLNGPVEQLLTASYGPETAKAVADRLVEGVALGKNPVTVARAASKALNLPLQRMVLIARTEQLRCYRTTTQALYMRGGVEYYVRMTAQDERVCCGCMAAEGERSRVADLFEAHPACRCVMVPDVAGGGLDAWPHGEEWLAGQPEHLQRSILGSTRYRMWSQGQVPWSKLATRTWDDTWGPAIQTTTIRELLAGGGGLPPGGAPTPLAGEAVPSTGSLRDDLAQLLARA